MLSWPIPDDILLGHLTSVDPTLVPNLRTSLLLFTSYYNVMDNIGYQRSPFLSNNLKLLFHHSVDVCHALLRYLEPILIDALVPYLMRYNEIAIECNISNVRFRWQTEHVDIKVEQFNQMLLRIRCVLMRKEFDNPRMYAVDHLSTAIDAMSLHHR
ncbi:hypothetical protein SAMD00019534_080640 [Acytostelium subglobosum LB1]|uniref:hypothetical protein n=1 Tax=Acytostelium subglobosum LB1 TaxID=1410327 RepID=UPI0006452300|nr:hypothetical protein SAMD00019534_080640 [Acytostelium subglobosum LB1]GAM24889.1 hypothetical protein SAMD00019534_080640 [Acytostelium subglobosum LB1]|eukprot:XP_012751978.1 hypothetical protein SAMD00019534_080640 [Acytostelium subglobosum LB1]